MNKMLKNEAGFTLIEIIVVLAVLGVLLLMVMPSVSDALSNTKQLDANSQSHSLNSASRQYEAEYGQKAESIDNFSSSTKVTGDEETKINSNSATRRGQGYEYTYDQSTGTVSVSKHDNK